MRSKLDGTSNELMSGVKNVQNCDVCINSELNDGINCQALSMLLGLSVRACRANIFIWETLPASCHAVIIRNSNGIDVIAWFEREAGRRVPGVPKQFPWVRLFFWSKQILWHYKIHGISVIWGVAVWILIRYVTIEESTKTALGCVVVPFTFLQKL